MRPAYCCQRQHACAGLRFEMTDRGDEGSPLGDIQHRLAQLRPSRELLDYYRSKIAEYDGEHSDMMEKLERYKAAYEQQVTRSSVGVLVTSDVLTNILQHQLEWELRQREEEIAELQKALSDMQVYLFQEREHVLRLYAENDRLKIRELEDRKRIQHLLALTQPVQSEVTYFPDKKVLVEQHRKKTSKSPSVLSGRGPGGHKKSQEEKQESDPSQEVESLALTIQSFQAQLEEQTRLAKEQLDAFMEDRRVRTEEHTLREERDASKIASLTDRLHELQDMLYDSTKDYLELKYEVRAKERQWMVEKDNLLQELDQLKEELKVNGEDSQVLDQTEMGLGLVDTRRQNQLVVRQLRNQMQQSQKLADMYREQCVQMEEELCRVREECEVSKQIFRERTEHLTKRLGLMNTRYQGLDKRRGLEVEGFKNDIKLLKQRLRDVEKQLYKVPLLTVCLCLPVYLSLSVSVCLCLSLFVSVCLHLSVSICLSVCLSACLSVCLSMNIYYKHQCYYRSYYTTNLEFLKMTTKWS